MKQMSLGKVAIATSAFACAALLSFSWSEQRGASLSIESAQARVGRPLTPGSVAGVARRQNRRAAYGYRYGARGVGAGLAGAAAVGTAAAIGSAAAFAASPPDDSNPYYEGAGGYDEGAEPGPFVGTGPAFVGTGPAVGTGAYVGAGPYVRMRPPIGTGAYIGTGPYIGTGAFAARAQYGAPVESRPFSLPTAFIEGGPFYGYSGWEDYKARNGITCDPGTMFKGGDGVMHLCQ